MVTITLASHAAGRVTVKIEGAALPLAVALRRTLMEDVRTHAIDTVDVAVNTSQHPDEYLAHRLGLLPLEQPAPGDETAPDTVFDLNVTNDTALDMKLTTAHLVPEHGPLQLLSGRVLPLGLLRPGQTLRLRASTAAGYGRTHAKWSPVTSVALRGGAKDGGDGATYELTFGTTGVLTPARLLREALHTIVQRLDAVVVNLSSTAYEPETPP